MSCSLLSAVVLLAVAASSLPAAEPDRFSAKVRVEVQQGETTLHLDTMVGGPLDRATQATLGGDDVTQVTLKVEPIVKDKQHSFKISFVVSQKRADGQLRILAQPTMVTLAGHPAKSYTRDQNGDFVALEFVGDVK